MRSLRLVVLSFMSLMGKNPWMAILWATCLVGGCGAGVYYLSEPFGMVRALFGGMLGGAGAGLILSINRLID